MELRVGKVIYLTYSQEELSNRTSSLSPMQEVREEHPDVDVIIGNAGGKSVILFNNLGIR